MTVLLELATNESVHCVISERLLHDVISVVDTEWMTMQMGYLSNGDNNINLSFSERTFLTDSEVKVIQVSSVLDHFISWMFSFRESISCLKLIIFKKG